MEKREVWVDNVKVIACTLVVLGHFAQSMVKSNIVPSHHLYHWFISTIYCFHVPLFFICSGYIYQKKCQVTTLKNWRNHVIKKACNLGIPYFTFSIITLLLKMFFSGYVNTKETGLFQTLFVKPTAPYWYLYILFLIFLITPTFRSRKKLIIAFSIALTLNFVRIFAWDQLSMPFAIYGILSYEIWFMIGMCMGTFEWKKYTHTKVLLLSPMFFILSVVIYVFNISFKGIGFLLGLIACAAIIPAIYYLFQNNEQNSIFGFLAKYTFPIFVMHTIFAATVRGILLKVGITNAVFHIILGLTASFLFPVIAAMIMDKTKYLNIFLYPSQFKRNRKASLLYQK